LEAYIESKNDAYEEDIMVMAILIYKIMFRDQLNLIICG
jgi:hypothetical protein